MMANVLTTFFISHHMVSYEITTYGTRHIISYYLLASPLYKMIGKSFKLQFLLKKLYFKKKIDEKEQSDLFFKKNF